MNRQCGIGYHEECSDPNGYECDCKCHRYRDRLENAGYSLAVLVLSGADAKGAAQNFVNIVNESPFADPPEEEDENEGL